MGAPMASSGMLGRSCQGLVGQGVHGGLQKGTCGDRFEMKCETGPPTHSDSQPNPDSDLRAASCGVHATTATASRGLRHTK